MKKLRVTLDGVSYEVEVEILEDDDDGMLPAIGSTAAPPQIAPRPAASTTNSAPPAPAPASKPSAAPSKSGSDKHVLTSPIAGVVVEVKVSVGETVKENDPVLVIEAMKMNTNVSSPVAGRVKEIKVSAGDAVQQGQVLLTFE